MGKHDTPRDLLKLALGLVAGGIVASVTLAPTIPALVIKTGSGEIDVPLTTSYPAFMEDMRKRTGAIPTVSDWDPWLEAYPVAVIASVWAAPVALVFASLVSDARDQFIAAATVILWAGNLAAGVYYLQILSYSNKNTVTSGNVVAGVSPNLLVAGAFISQLVLVFGRVR